MKQKDWESSEELMDRLGLKVRVEQLAKVNRVRWYGHVLRREKDDVLRRVKKTWKKQMEEDIKKIKLKKEKTLQIEESGEMVW